MAIDSLKVTRGFGNGTFDGVVKYLVRQGFTVPAPVVAGTPAGTTTTYEAIRDNVETLIVDINPLREQSVKFWRAESMIDFRSWCEENVNACFRGFDIEWIGTRPDPGGMVTSTHTEMVITEAELVVAYPHQLGLYGEENRRDMQDMMISDGNQIRKAIGIQGGSNYPDGLYMIEASFSAEPGDDVDFLVFELELTYRFDVAAI